MKDAGPEGPSASPSGRRLSATGMMPPAVRGFEDSVEILGVLRAVWLRRGLILSACLLTALLFGLVALAQQPRYTATATVMLDPREQRVVATQDQVVSDLKLNSPILESEVAIIRSTALLRMAIQEVGPDRYNVMDPARESTGFFSGIAATIRSVLSSGNSADFSASVPPEERRLNRLAHVLKQDLNVRRVGDSYVIEIGVKTPDPILSAATANALAEGYIAQQLQERRRVARSATQWLADQAATRQSELTAAEQAVAAHNRAQLSQSGASDALLEQSLSALNAELVEVRAARTDETARLQQIERFISENGPLAAAETQQSPVLLSLRAARSERVQTDLQLAVTLGPGHPDRLALARELDQIDASIRQEVDNIAQSYRNEISVLEIQETALEVDVARVQKTLADNATAMLTLRQLEREAEAAHETYEELLNRLGETRAQAEIQRAEARMVNAAQIPLAPSSPRVKLLAAFGATVGLTVGLLAALSVELVSAGFLNAAEVERSTGLAVMTSIPKDDIKSPADVLAKVNGHAFSLFAERIRHLRTMLEMGGPHAGCHAIVVLSSHPEEGKTTTALALARSYATMGRKTLLLDLDTRKSALTHELTQASLRDLGDYLAGDATLSDVIYGDESLGFSLAGSSRYTAILADSVSTGVLKDVVDQLKERFEVIVIDSPPLLAVSDGLQIASVSDSIIYLVQHRITSRKSALHGLSALHHVGLRPTGIVLTKARFGSEHDSYASAPS